MEITNLLILLHYYTVTFGWTVFQIISLLLLIYVVNKYNIFLLFFFRLFFFLLFATFVMTLFENQIWAKRLMEITFLLVFFTAIQTFFKSTTEQK